MKLSEKIQEALRQQQEINLSDPAVQKRLAAQWGYVPADAQPAPSFADAYQGAMEEVAIWKRRALEAEDLNRKFIAEINGPMHMGEQAQPAPSIPEGWKPVPIEVIYLYSIMCAAFVPMTPQQEEIALQLDLAKRAMLAVAPEFKP